MGCIPKLGFRGCVRGVCAGPPAARLCSGAWGSLRRMCVGCRVWGAVRGVRREGLWRACVVVWAGGEGMCRGARGFTRWWACVSHRIGSGEGGAGVGVAGGVVELGLLVLCGCMCPLAAAHLCGHL